MKSKETKQIQYKDRRDAGFTLIEMVFAVTILAVGVLAVASMQAASLRGTHHAYNVTEGTTWAQEKLEGLMTRSYSHSDMGAGTHTETQGDYTVTWVVTEDSPVDNTKTIDVDVSWTASGGAEKVSSLDFIVADII